MLFNPYELTCREKEILVMLGLGFSDGEIADKTNVQTGTVKGYVHRLLGRVGVKNRTQLAIAAYQLGMVCPYDIDLWLD
jgi:DNA-binding NarL/FixJ family response regulator